MSRATLLIVGAALLAALAGAWVGGAVFAPKSSTSADPLAAMTAAGATPTLAIGDRRPDAVLADPSGVQWPLSQFDGAPLVVNFWATWCPPCVRELPLLDQWHERRDGDGLAVVAIALESDRELVQAFIERRALALPVRLSAPGRIDLSSQFGNSRGVLPFSVLVGADGRVLAQKMGELDAAKLEQWRQLAEQAAALD